MTADTEQTELGLLLEDAGQTVVFLENNDALRPDIHIFKQAANIMRALIEAAKPCGHMSASKAYKAAWIKASSIYISSRNYNQELEKKRAESHFLQWRDQQ